MTTSQPAAARGSQKPRVLTRPPFVSEAAGLEAIELAREVGLILDPWQQLFVRVALAERSDGRYAASSVAQLVARQNGKGAGLEAIVLHGMFLVEDPLTLWTSHQFKTSAESFLRMKSLVDGSDHLRRRVKKINEAHGDEGIELRNGVRLRFLARSKASGRGFSPQRIIWDEAQELSKVAFEAMRPSMRAQRNPQSIYAGTVPGPEINNPEHWTRLRDRGRSATGRRLAWLEWSPKGSDDAKQSLKINLDDPKVWAESSPGLGYRLEPQTLADDREEMDDDSFGREALSIWPDDDPSSISVIDLDAWQASTNRSAPKPTTAVLHLDVSPDRRKASIGVAADGTNGRTLVLTRTRAGHDWVVPAVKDLIEKQTILDVRLHPGTQAAVLLADLQAAGIDFTPVTTADAGRSCALFIEMVAAGRIEHVGQPELDAAVTNAITRFTTGEAELWDRRDRSIDITALVAASGAVDRWAMTNDYDVADSYL